MPAEAWEELNARLKLFISKLMRNIKHIDLI